MAARRVVASAAACVVRRRFAARVSEVVRVAAVDVRPLAAVEALRLPQPPGGGGIPFRCHRQATSCRSCHGSSSAAAFLTGGTRSVQLCRRML